MPSASNEMAGLVDSNDDASGSTVPAPIQTVHLSNADDLVSVMSSPTASNPSSTPRSISDEQSSVQTNPTTISSAVSSATPLSRLTTTAEHRRLTNAAHVARQERQEHIDIRTSAHKAATVLWNDSKKGLNTLKVFETAGTLTEFSTCRKSSGNDTVMLSSFCDKLPEQKK